MNKLTNMHAAVFSPLRDRSAFAAVVPFRSTSARTAPNKAVVQRRGLQCSWARNEAGHLVCSWSEDSPTLEQSIAWRGTSRAGAAMRMAA